MEIHSIILLLIFSIVYDSFSQIITDLSVQQCKNRINQKITMIKQNDKVNQTGYFYNKVDLPTLTNLWCQFDSDQKNVLSTAFTDLVNNKQPELQPVMDFWDQLEPDQQNVLAQAYQNLTSTYPKDSNLAIESPITPKPKSRLLTFFHHQKSSKKSSSKIRTSRGGGIRGAADDDDDRKKNGGGGGGGNSNLLTTLLPIALKLLTSSNSNSGGGGGLSGLLSLASAFLGGGN